MQPPVDETSDDVQMLFRQVNERVRDLNTDLGPSARIADFVCECRDPECSERLTLSLEQFDAIRSHPNRHVVRSDHLEPAYEHTVDLQRGFSVVERDPTLLLARSRAAA